MIIKIAFLVGSLLIMPVLFFGGMWLSKGSFQKEQNINRRYFGSPLEWIILAVSELLAVRVWYSFIYHEQGRVIYFALYMSILIASVVTVTDIWENIISNKVLIIGLFFFILVFGVSFFVDSEKAITLLKDALLGFVFSLISFGVVYVVTRGGIGAGDVKLALVLGLLATIRYSVRILLYGCVIGAIFAIVMLALKKYKRDSTFPFGPFMFAGMAIAYILG